MPCLRQDCVVVHSCGVLEALRSWAVVRAHLWVVVGLEHTY